MSLDQAHIQNEQARDAFIGLGHTALLAASISFVSDVIPLAGAILKPVLLISWMSGVIGLLALTMSFGEATRAIDKRRQAINEETAPQADKADRLNRIAVWTFPVSLITLFLFLAANVVCLMSESEKRPNSLQISTHGMSPPPRAPATTSAPKPLTGVVPAPQPPIIAPSPPPSPKK